MYRKDQIRNIFARLRYLVTRLFHFFGSSSQPITSDNNPVTDQFRSIVVSAKQHAQESQEILANIGPKIQIVIDHADVILPLIPYISPEGMEKMSVLWGEVNRETELIHNRLEETMGSTDAVSGTASLTSVTASGILYEQMTPFSCDPDFNSALDRFIEVTTRPTLKDDVIHLIKTFHLDIAPAGKKSTLELFQTAHLAFDVPVSQGEPAITSLIPMREAINSAIDQLLRLRPIQEKTGSSDRKKILSIGTQLKKSIIDDVVIQQWADQWHDINDNDLSGSKRHQMTREEWRHRLFRATQFLYSFLSGLDPEKLRKSIE